MDKILLNQIKLIAQEAGNILMKYRGGDLDIKTKADETDFVTKADKEADVYIRSQLLKLFPNDQVLSEESNDEVTNFQGRVWIVDPLDGTKYYISGGDTFSIMIGLAIDGKPNFGMVYAPALNIYYWAEKDKGAWKQEVDGSIKKLSVNNTSSIDNIKLVMSPSYTGERVKDKFISSSLHIRELMRLGSGGLKVGKIAEGEADASYFPEDNTGKWDFCAADIIIKEAGGIFTDSSGNEVDYSVPKDQFPKVFICSNGKIHDFLIKQYENFIKDIYYNNA